MPRGPRSGQCRAPIPASGGSGGRPLAAFPAEVPEAAPRGARSGSARRRAGPAPSNPLPRGVPGPRRGQAHPLGEAARALWAVPAAGRRKGLFGCLDGARRSAQRAPSLAPGRTPRGQTALKPATAPRAPTPRRPVPLAPCLLPAVRPVGCALRRRSGPGSGFAAAAPAPLRLRLRAVSPAARYIPARSVRAAAAGPLLPPPPPGARGEGGDRAGEAGRGEGKRGARPG